MESRHAMAGSYVMVAAAFRTKEMDGWLDRGCVANIRNERPNLPQRTRLLIVIILSTLKPFQPYRMPVSWRRRSRL